MSYIFLSYLYAIFPTQPISLVMISNMMLNRGDENPCSVLDVLVKVFRLCSLSFTLTRGTLRIKFFSHIHSLLKVIIDSY